MFGVLSCVGSFRGRMDVVGSEWACEVWRGGLSDIWAIGFSDWVCASWMAVLIGGVLANQRSVWEGRNIVCALFFYALRSGISCFQFFMFCSTGTRVVVMCIRMLSMQLFFSRLQLTTQAPPAYCISRKRRTYTLLWGRQHIEAVRFNVTFLPNGSDKRQLSGRNVVGYGSWTSGRCVAAITDWSHTKRKMSVKGFSHTTEFVYDVVVH